MKRVGRCPRGRMRAGILCGLFLCAPVDGLRAQFTLTLIQPNEITLANADIWNCIITNAGNNAADVYLHGIVTEASRGRVLEMRSADFLLSIGTTQFNTGNYEPLAPEQTIYNDADFREYVVRTNTVPNGSYTICLTLFDRASATVLATSCSGFVVNNATPPSLLSPTDGSALCEPFPFFIWTPYRPLEAQMLTYGLRIVELLNSQSAQAALYHNPAWFTQSDIVGPLYQYPFSGLPFVHGTRYAWMVEVLQNGKRIAVSDISMFTWENCLGADSTTTTGPAVPINRKRPGLSYYDLTPYPTAEVAMVDGNGLNVAIRNDLPLRQVLCRVLGPSGAEIRTLPVQLAPGFNYLDLDVSGWNIRSGQVYTLAFTDPLGRAQRLRFTRMP